MYGLSDGGSADPRHGAGFVESLMPHEVEAELAGGMLPRS